MERELFTIMAEFLVKTFNMDVTISIWPSKRWPKPIHYRRRPRRPPFLLVLSVGMGVTSSILPMRIPALASARSADWAPGPGVFEPFPGIIKTLNQKWYTSSSTDLDVESSNSQFLASCCNILSSQHSCIRRALVSIGLDLHTSCRLNIWIDMKLYQ